MCRVSSTLLFTMGSLAAFPSPGTRQYAPRAGSVGIGSYLLLGQTSLQPFLDTETSAAINAVVDQDPHTLFTHTSNSVSTIARRLEEMLLANSLAIYRIGSPSFPIPVFMTLVEPGAPDSSSSHGDWNPHARAEEFRSERTLSSTPHG